MFDEFKQESFGFNSSHSNHIYFAPNYHFKYGLVSESDIERFSHDKTKKLLSIGSGAAYLERLLVELGVPKENVVLSDIVQEALPKNFKTKVFDKQGDWAELGEEKFDLIIFPASALLNDEPDEYSWEQSLKHRIQGLYHLLSKSLDHLNERGVVRLDAHNQIDETIEPTMSMLTEAGYHLSFKSDTNLIEVTKIK